MRYKAEQKISNQVFTEKIMKEERLFRDVAFRMVNELPIDKLKLLFNLKAVYGFKDDLEKAYKEGDIEKFKQIRRLMDENCSLFTGEV